MAAPRMLVLFGSIAAVVVLAFIAAVAIGAWWILPVALLAHAIGTMFVVSVIGKRTEQEEKPDPVTAARLEEESVEQHGERSQNGRQTPSRQS